MSCNNLVLFGVVSINFFIKPKGKVHHGSTYWACLVTPASGGGLVCHPVCPIAGTQNAEPDACLGTWQGTGAAAISRLDHDSARGTGSLHQSIADSLKIAKLSSSCQPRLQEKQGSRRRRRWQNPKHPTAPLIPLPDAPPSCVGSSRESVPIKLPMQNRRCKQAGSP